MSLISYTTEDKYNLEATASRLRNGPPTAIVLHWTGGLRGVDSVVETLRNRGLSYHYIVEVDGKVHQLVDPHRVAYHAGAANEWSIGIALVGRNASEFTDDQRTAAVSLAYQLSGMYQMDIKEEDIYVDRLPNMQLSSNNPLHGVFGHYHLKATKLDPSEGFMLYVRSAWPDSEIEEEETPDSGIDFKALFRRRLAALEEAVLLLKDMENLL